MKISAFRFADYFKSRGGRVVVHREPRQLPLKQHRHEFLEIALILSGSGIHVTGRFRHRIEAGDVLVISRHRPHGYEQTLGLNLVNILIREDILPRLARDLRQLPGFHALFTMESLRWNTGSYGSRLRLNSSDLAQVSDWADRLEEESRQKRPGGHVLSEAYLVLIMGILSRRYGRQGSRSLRSEGRLGRLLSWIELHLQESFGVERMAVEAGMSLRSFQRHFRIAAGRSPLDYLLQQRIDRAKDLLLTRPNMRIAEVADRCGFSDSNYFSRLFRDRVGISPENFKRGKKAFRK